MQLTTLSKILDLNVKLLVGCISVWIFFYAFDRRLVNWLGQDLYVQAYTWLSRLISLSAILIFIFAVWFVLKSQSENKK